MTAARRPAHRARSGCARGGRARRCRRSGSRSAWPRWSPCSASPSPPRPTCWPSSTSSGRTCSGSPRGSRSWATTRCCRRRRAAMLRRVSRRAVGGRDGRRRRRDRPAHRRSSTRTRPAASASPRRTRRCAPRSARRWRTGRSSTPRPAATRRSCSAPRRPTRSASPTPARACGSAGAGSPSIGILDPFTLAPQLDTAALIGFDVAESLFGADGNRVDGLRARRPGPRRGRARPARRDRQPGATRRRSRSRARPTPWRPARRPRPRSRRCSSGWARWRCSSAASGSRT